MITFLGGIVNLKLLAAFVKAKVRDDQVCSWQPTVPGLDALQLWLLPQWEESETKLHLASKSCNASLASLSTVWVEHHCTRPMDFPQRTSRKSLFRMASIFTRSDAI
ncbi:hypothetical protein TNCV_461541 [Trichonephila clavipes]|nr:hypothetical protein TNCV_461541 [Trichonephila clavipes]